MTYGRSRALFVSLAFSVLFTFPAAAMQHRVEGKAFAILERPVSQKAKLKIERFPLADGELATLQLERFDVMAPNGKVVVYDSEGKGHEVKPVPMSFFRGRVEGVDDSLVYISTTADSIEGFVFTRDRKFMLASRKPMKNHAGRAIERDVLVDEVPPQFEFTDGGYTCEFEDKLITPTHGMVPRSLTFQPEPQAALTGTQATVLNLAIESDTALYSNFSSNAVSVETFLRNLIAAAATIYLRDLHTDLDIVYLGIRTTSDPWTVNPGTVGSFDGASTNLTSLHALLEYGDYWHNSPPISRGSRSAAMLISGQSQTAGIAWTDNVCSNEFHANNDFYYDPPILGHYGGPYSYCGGVGLDATNRNVPNPNGLPNFAAPSSGYWPLLQVTHELGHTVQSSHTHCIGVDPVTYGRSYVDLCYDAAGCYNGANAVPAEKGTIMSYCHLLGGGAQTRFTFGQSGEASTQVINLMRARLNDKTPSLSTITAPVSVSAGGSGTASVSNTGLSYTWTIANGTFTGGVTTITGPSVNFTANTNPVTLTVIATNTVACSITDTITVSVGAGLSAPTGLIATATGSTSVGLTWASVAGATGYQILRSHAGTGGFAPIDTSVSNSFTDNTAIANTAYLYRVRATAGATTSPDSNYDLATTIVFTDPSLSTGVTMKAVHMTEARTAVNAVRTLAGIGAGTFTDPSLVAGITAKATHLNELRSYLSAARLTLSLPTLTYTDTITSGSAAKALHVTEIRNGTQ